MGFWSVFTKWSRIETAATSLFLAMPLLENALRVTSQAVADKKITPEEVAQIDLAIREVKMRVESFIRLMRELF